MGPPRGGGGPPRPRPGGGGPPGPGGYRAKGDEAMVGWRRPRPPCGGGGPYPYGGYCGDGDGGGGAAIMAARRASRSQ